MDVRGCIRGSVMGGSCVGPAMAAMEIVFRADTMLPQQYAAACIKAHVEALVASVRGDVSIGSLAAGRRASRTRNGQPAGQAACA